MYEKIQKQISSTALIIAVPLHKKRLRERKFNQAILLSKSIAKLAPSLKFYPDFLLRTKYTKSQTALSQKDRGQNLRNVFALNTKYYGVVQGKTILLVDDVMTTGTTLEECARILKKAGAAMVVGVVVAKRVLDS